MRATLDVSLSVLFGVAAAWLLLPTLSDLLSALRWLLLHPHRTATPAVLPSPLPRLLILVPAHDESLLIGHTLTSVRAVDYPADRLSVVVIADNCTDDTADIVRGMDVACLERHDELHRGKPWALHWALEVLPVAEYDAMIVLDADTVVEPSFCREIAASGPLRSRAFQTYNDVSNAADSPLTRMSAIFAAARFRLINGLKERAALNVPLVNGLVMGTDVHAVHGWSAFSITEDWEMYASLTAAGIEIRNVPRARNMAQEARSLAQAGSQRERWTAGKLNVLIQLAPALLRSRRIGLPQKLDALAELSAPGPVVLAVFSGAAVLSVVLLRVPAWNLLAIAFALPTIRTFLFTAAAVPLVDAPLRSAGAFLYLLLYAPWRIAVQFRALRLLRDPRWIRTGRHVSPRRQPADG